MAEAITGQAFYEIAALLFMAAAAGFIGVLLRQPLIVSFIAVGIIAGSVLRIAYATEHIALLAELGVAILLFLVGLKLDLKLVRTLGAVALVTGLGQVIFTSVLGFLIGFALGFDAVTSLYVAVALTFSSTIIIVKLLSDKKEIDSLHGRIALGFLIVQDLVVVVAMIALSALGIGATEDTGSMDILWVFASGALMLAGIGLFSRYLATPLVERLARAPELLVSFAIGWSALLAAVGDYLGFGKELGGLLAGVSLASTPFREAISSRLVSLRDFLLLFFFISLGAGVDVDLLGENVMPAIIFSLFVLIGNPLIVLVIMSVMGYHKRTGFMAGLTVAQISEFSLIFMAVGVTLGHVTEEALGLVTLVGLITISASTYMIMNSQWLYDKLGGFLAIFSRHTGHSKEDGAALAGEGYHVILFGLGRYGGGIAQQMRAAGKSVLGVDFSPVPVRHWRERGFDVVYGDAIDPEFLSQLPLKDVEWAVSAVPEHDTGVTHTHPARALIRGLKDAGFGGRIAVATNNAHEVGRLKAAGADVVFLPFRDAANQAADLLLGERPPSGFEDMEPKADGTLGAQD